MKFQSVMFSCGIIGHLFGPYEGRRHDATMLYASGLVQQMRQHIQYNGVEPDFTLFGDKGYPLEPEVLTPFRGEEGVLSTTHKELLRLLIGQAGQKIYRPSHVWCSIHKHTNTQTVGELTARSLLTFLLMSTRSSTLSAWW